MIETIELGPAPCNEDCVQVSSKEDYMHAMTREVQRYIEMLRRRFPEHEKMGIVFRNKWFPHDFGGYREAIAVFNGDDVEAMEYACWMEEYLPLTWDDESVLVMKNKPQEAAIIA